MIDTQVPTGMELEATFSLPIESEYEDRMPLGFTVFGVLAFLVQVLWLGLIGWWLLNLF